MNKFKKTSPLRTLVLGACAATLFAALGPQQARAAAAIPAPATAANATILNVVTVTYFDANGSTEHKAATSSSVTIALKKAQLTVEAAAFPAVDSGAHTKTSVALTSNANGSDAYKVEFGSSLDNLKDSSLVGRISSDKNGPGTDFTSGSNVSLGATSIVSVAAASGGTQVLTIPGGALNGIAKGSVVVIKNVEYKVADVFEGSAATYDIAVESTTEGTRKAEVYGTITLTIDAESPALVPAEIGAGVLVNERKYLLLDDYAVVKDNIKNGTDNVTVVTTVDGSHTDATTTATFYYAQLSIKKEVAVPSGGATPGQELTYTITVKNLAPNGNAHKVSIADAVPAYTTLVAAGDGTFATIAKNGGTPVNVTLDLANNDGVANANIGFGETEGKAITAGKKIFFYIGANASKAPATGGTVAKNDTYVITYKVKID